jgi:hypothetical protein
MQGLIEMFETNYDTNDLYIVANMDKNIVMGQPVCMTTARDRVLDCARNEPGSRFGVFQCDGIYVFRDIAQS